MRVSRTLKLLFGIALFSAGILAAQIRIFSTESLLSFPTFKLDEYLRRPKICLTFDDGPQPYYTYQILDILEREGARATFFVVGKQVQSHPDLLRAIDSSGNEIENHTYNHFNLTTLTPEQIASELKTNGDLIHNLIGKTPRYFRPPGGNYDGLVAKVAQEQGIDMVLWSVMGNDTVPRTVPKICQSVLSNVGANGIILLHSGVEQTLEALPAIIRELKRRGYRFVTLSDLAEGEGKNHT